MVVKVSGVVNGHAREGVALLLSKRVLEGVVEYREVSDRLMWVKVKFGGEFWVFVSAYMVQGVREVMKRERHSGVS